MEFSSRFPGNSSVPVNRQSRVMLLIWETRRIGGGAACRARAALEQDRRVRESVLGDVQLLARAEFRCWETTDLVIDTLLSPFRDAIEERSRVTPG